MTCPPHDRHDEYLADFRRRWTAIGLADTLGRMMDGVEELHGKVSRLEAAALRGEPRNAWGATDDECILGWRFTQVGLGMDPKLAARSFPSTSGTEPTPIPGSEDEWFSG